MYSKTDIQKGMQLWQQEYLDNPEGFQSCKQQQEDKAEDYAIEATLKLIECIAKITKKHSS